MTGRFRVLTMAAVTTRIHKSTAVTLGLALLVVLGGCGGSSHATKEGTKTSGQITLKMETPDSPQASAEFFAKRVDQLTHGHLRVIQAADYSSADPANEVRLAAALRQGKVQMAYMPSRAWERDGGRVLGFRALQAPFLITSYPLLHQVATGPVARQLLASLRRENVVGLGLVPDELRRLLSRKPLFSAGDFQGARIRVVTSPTTERIFRALGAEPVTNLTADQVGPALAAGKLAAVETSMQAIANNSYNKQASYLAANLPVFAKTQTIAISKRTFGRLDSGDRKALEDAAAATAAQADPGTQERSELKAICTSGLRIAPVSAAGIESLQRAASPVYAQLESDASTKQAIGAIQQLKQQVPVAQSVVPSCAHGPATQPTSQRFPTGTFETKLTADDVVKAGFPANKAHWEALTFRKDGTWLDVWFHPRQADNPPGGGRYIVRGDTVKLTPAGPDTVKWSYFRGQLTFQIVSVPDSFAQFTYTAHPWRKIG